MSKKLDVELLKKLNIEASKNKKKTFILNDVLTVRSEYGIIETGECCGNQCFFCVYDKVRGSTEQKKINFDW